MIYLERNIVNNICLTLTESTSLVNPYFLFIFESEFNKELDPFAFVLMDISDYPDRYNLFEFEVPDTGDIMPSGQYAYSVYECETETTDTSLGTLIEEGRMIIELEATQTTIYD